MGLFRTDIFTEVRVRFFFWLLLTSVVVSGQEFMVRLQMDNAHVQELYFACKEGCSIGYDSGNDIYCPPGGMGNRGLAWFVVTEPKQPALYKDVRGCVFPQQWTLFAQPPQDGSLTFSWAEAQFPDGLVFELRHAEKVIDMRTVRQFSVTEKTELVIAVSKPTVAAGEQENGKK